MNIPPRLYVRTSEFLPKILFAKIPNKTVTNHKELEKAATCMTFVILFVGVPLRRNKSKKKPAIVIPIARIKWNASSTPL
jgi:hypothetical protein